MFFMVGIIYDRVHHRDLEKFGGLFGKMPFYTAMAIALFFAGLGLPGLCGFIGEVFVVLSVFNYSVTLAVIAASVVIITAAYILWAVQRVYLGAEYRGPHEEAITPSTVRERCIGSMLVALAIIFGVFPYQTVFKYMDKTISRQVTDLARWTQQVKVPQEQAERQAAERQAAARAGTAPRPADAAMADSSAATEAARPPGQRQPARAAPAAGGE
jgi:NADH-quinone oxidoreductase subunit M